MGNSLRWQSCLLFCLMSVLLISSCAERQAAIGYHNRQLPLYHGHIPYTNSFDQTKYVALLPQKVNYGKEKVIVVDPKIFAWGAYDKEGTLVRGGIANAGADFCKDKGRPCRTATGAFRIYSLGAVDCVSRTYPLPKGGALMPYCMFFYKGQSLHGTPDALLVAANTSHGCIHMRIPDAEWLRLHFVQVGTKVIILPYSEQLSWLQNQPFPRQQKDYSLNDAFTLIQYNNAFSLFAEIYQV